MASQLAPKWKFVPHRVIRSAWTYLTVADDPDHVIGLKMVVVKTAKLFGADNKPVITDEGGPNYQAQVQTVLRVLTKAEWEVVRQLEREGAAGD